MSVSRCTVDLFYHSAWDDDSLVSIEHHATSHDAARLPVPFRLPKTCMVMEAAPVATAGGRKRKS